MKQKTKLTPRRAAAKTATYVILFVASFLFMLPFIAMLFNAVKPEYEILGYPPTFFPHEFTLENFKAVLTNDSMHLLSSLFNSILVATIRTAFTIYFAALWGYALSKLKFPGRKLLFYMILSAMMVPTAVNPASPLSGDGVVSPQRQTSLPHSGHQQHHQLCRLHHEAIY